MHDIADFLGSVPPFDALDPERLEQVAAACAIEFVPSGQTIYVQGAPPATEARVIRRGAVELIDQGQVVDLLGEGEMFGHASVLSSDPLGLTVRAHEDTLCYVIPAEVIRPVLAHPSAIRYVVRSIGGRFEMRVRDMPTQPRADPAVRQVGELVRSPAVVVAPGTPVRDAASRMAEAGSSSVLVELPDGLGILTDRDLRTRVVAAGAAPDTPVSEVMSAPARTVTADRGGVDVLLEMLDRGVRHFPVIDAHRRLVGVISDTDLMAVETRTPFHLRSAIARAADVDDLATAAAQLPATVVSLHDARTAPEVISRVITTVHDALTRRLLEFAEASLGHPDVPYTWFALGSFARREAYPSSDQDSALAWAGPDDDQQLRRWMRELGEMVVANLERCGVPSCPQGVVASRPLFARSIDEWERVARSWLDDPDQEKALILVSVLVDGRAVWAADVAGDRLQSVFADARDRPRLLRLLERFALAHRPPTGFFRDFVVEHDGEHKGRLDIKRGGVLPVADLARAAGMAAGVSSATTVQRLQAAAAGGTMSERDAADLRDAFELFSELRMEHQVARLRGGETPDDHIDVTQLSRLTRTYLKEALRAVARVQRGLGAIMSLTW
ncbi:MAG: putative nucleotidyltransferase substrate binding domain-containing protein [Gaiellales bacterium]